MNIMSIQSWVAFGHVGNASAMFPLQRLGHEVWAVNTVQFSNHTGYGAWRGQVFSGDAVRDVVAGIEERGVLPACNGVLSGYMGSAEIGEAITDAVSKVKAANGHALYCCDPVIGDVGRGVFVRPGVPEFMRERAVSVADVVTPNQFELEYLTGQAVTSREDARRAIARLHEMGPRVALVTSVRTEDTPEDAVDLLASDGAHVFRVRTPLLPLSINGAGDAIAALFFCHLLTTRDTAAALSKAASSVYGLLRRTADSGSREIMTVAAQDEFVAPSTVFQPEQV